MARRLWLAGIGLAAFLVAAFLLLRLLPGDPAGLRLQRQDLGGQLLEAEMRQRLGTDRPLAQQLAIWIGDALRGDLGRSFATDRPLAPELARRLPWSLAVGMGGLLLGAAIGTGLGYASVVRGGSAELAGRTFALAGQVLPSFGIALLLLWLLAGHWQLLRPLTGPPAERLLLPILVVAFFAVGSFARVVSRTLEGVERSPFFLTALTKGLRRSEALRRHGGRHVMLAVLAVLTPELAWAVGGTAIVEVVFGLPGLSAFVVEGLRQRDYPLLQAFLLVAGSWIVLARALVGVMVARFDPRPRHAL